MRKSWMVLAGCLFVLTLLIGLFFAFSDSFGQTSENDMDQKDFLEDKKAAVYFSTTADQDMDGKGKSFAVFFDKMGTPNTFEMKGLELGSIGVKDGKVLLEDKENFYSIANGFRKIRKEEYQHTGDHIGYLDQKNGFYALYNSGYDKESGGYRSDYYWEEDGEFKKGVIPFFIEASVMHKGTLYTLSSSEDEKTYKISEVKIGEETPPKTLFEIKKNENSTTFGQLQADEKNLYFIRQTGNITEMVKVDRKTGEKTFTKVASYSNDEETLYKQTPFSFKRCVFLHNEDLYFIDGFGDVYRIQTGSGESVKVFSLSEDSMAGSLETFYRDGNLYVFSINHEDNSAKIEQYSLPVGRKSGEMLIKHFPELNTFNKKVYLYDFVMLQDLK